MSEQKGTMTCMAPADMNLQLSNEALSEAAQAAVMSLITGDQQVEIFKGAIQSILSTKGPGWGSKTPLQLAFDDAVAQLVQEVAREVIDQNPELRDRVKTMVKDTVTKLLESDSDLQTYIGPAIADAVNKWRREGGH